MKWPFVSRHAHEILAESLKREQLHGVFIQTQLTLYQQMLKPAAVPHVIDPETAEAAWHRKVGTLAGAAVTEESKPSFLQSAIREQAQGDPRLRQYLTNYAAKLKREDPNITDEERAQAVSNWSSTEPDTTTTVSE